MYVQLSLRLYSFDNAPVKVVVGLENKCFYVHASALTATSDFFKSALKKEWNTTDDRSIDLNNETPDQFNTYVQWLYSGEVSAGRTSEASKDIKSEIFVINQYITLATLYVLGERLNDTTFQDSVINAMVFNLREKTETNRTICPASLVINTIYDNTTRKSPVRRLLVDIYVRYGNESFEVSDEVVNHEFLSELSHALVKDRVLLHKDEKNYNALICGIPCGYHNHDKDRPCQFK